MRLGIETQGQSAHWPLWLGATIPVEPWSPGTLSQRGTGLSLSSLNESGSTKTCPACLTRNRPSTRHHRYKNPDCGFSCHRDAPRSNRLSPQ
ncbi:MAG: zinc ribbon domain-containing protein, partial [Ferrimicrobium sp.]